MEYKNNCNCPRDMVNDELLRIILDEKECCTGIFGCGGRRQSETGNSGSFKCRERRQDPRDDCRKKSNDGCRAKENRCGCRENREEPMNRCGCRERRGESINTGCGCRDKYEGVSNTGCGCRENIGNESRMECSEKCARENCLSSFSLAMVYSPDQEWRDMYCEEEALENGTMFRELNLPFYPACRSCD